ncbi:hypothetical protein PAXINDRAFT_21109 [Paxillus involutus ATCC 200175]|uniref:Uncharacterized protein n=1 Tax=Paxillus involutus ATCC 200175 TaxID=664439 RepID=A0A0C9SM69_PAXIN|nr:hypothetical protein PAXINDRAFT_21109 [Paxillus involutus ATCC 200175]
MHSEDRDVDGGPQTPGHTGLSTSKGLDSDEQNNAVGFGKRSKWSGIELEAVHGQPRRPDIRQRP